MRGGGCGIFMDTLYTRKKTFGTTNKFKLKFMMNSHGTVIITKHDLTMTYSRHVLQILNYGTVANFNLQLRRFSVVFII